MSILFFKNMKKSVLHKFDGQKNILLKGEKKSLIPVFAPSLHIWPSFL